MVTTAQSGAIAAVTYFQHNGYYTRMAGNNGVPLHEGTHPIVLVGKVNHGSYHDNSLGTGGCG
jgi:hypothetical protein